ncbi:MAG: alkylhydroperoxidase AhpD family core protein [Nocardioidaceae bacterium]|nr:alkylhydroperoxidase AhpD family core protein [Nocardioidaceae bacterium]
MSRIAPTEPDVYEAAFGPDATNAEKVFAHAPEIAKAYLNFGAVAREHTKLPFRLVELVRLRVAFHNQCRLCMSLRYEGPQGEQALEEGLVCSLAKPYEAPDLSPAEVAALAYADKMATDHLSINDATFDDLRKHFDNAQIMEFCLRVAANVGFGRMAAVLDVIPQDELPDELRGDGTVAPWELAVVSS